MRLLAVIPARGGSKRIPRKNVTPLAGQPMMAYTIEAAIESGLFDRVVVSTDDDGIAGIAAELGADPEDRPGELADDHVPISRVTSFVVQSDAERNGMADSVCQLMANCPLRTAADIRSSYFSFSRSESPAQISVAAYGWQPAWWAARVTETGGLDPLFPETLRERSQDLDVLVCPTGAIWWARGELLCETGTFHVPGRTAWVMDRLHALDVDEPDDLRIAEALMQARLTDGH